MAETQDLILPSTMAEIEEAKSDVKQKKKSKGKRKIPIAPIQNKASRQVSFSKRRAGLFKKASELSYLCGAEVAVISFSGAGKLFSFGNPTVDDVILRYLSSSCYSSTEGKEVISSIEKEKESIEPWWNEPIDEGLGLEELEELKVSIEGLRNRVFTRLCEMNYDVNNNNNNINNCIYNNYNNGQQIIDFGSLDNSNNNWNNVIDNSNNNWNNVIRN